MKNSIFARFARAFFFFWHFEDVLVLSRTWNDLFCSCVDDVSIWWQLLNFVFLCLKRWFQFNSWIVRTHFSTIMSLNNWKMITETRSHIFRWRSRFRRRRVCLSSLFSKNNIERAQTSIILAGKTWYRRHFSTRLCKNVVEGKQVKNTAVVLPFFHLQKGSVTSNENNWAIYTANKK